MIIENKQKHKQPEADVQVIFTADFFHVIQCKLTSNNWYFIKISINGNNVGMSGSFLDTQV